MREQLTRIAIHGALFLAAVSTRWPPARCWRNSAEWQSASHAFERLLSRLKIGAADVADGSASAGRARDLTAGERTPKLSDRIADFRGRQVPTPSHRWHFSGRAAAPLRKRSLADHLGRSSSCESNHSRVVRW